VRRKWRTEIGNLGDSVNYDVLRAGCLNFKGQLKNNGRVKNFKIPASHVPT
jgi:hypothetical protein